MSIPSSTLGLPKVLPVTGTFAVPLTALSALLSLNVVKQRIDLNTWQGEKTHGQADATSTGVQQPDGHYYDPLLIATRVHANLLENLPLTLLLAASVELNGGSKRNLARILLAFTVLRVSHVIGLTKAAASFRATAYFGTTGIQLGLAGWSAMLVKSYWGF
ncbi:hypothetical protein K431DRAFT_284244 [Polychaeton citri CBS 116435]|uniref:Membrane-associated proteins in eicosanoid and glutathione metabolism n=1 Tax=Polychaeton citri CBS 116435 TaxID=1314669 RepID=A0A9P4UN68_9PEZI|nr:hypothetical protein K431DRAFT_284244 [Polychaeton citri CBS 116435]